MIDIYYHPDGLRYWLKVFSDFEFDERYGKIRNNINKVFWFCKKLFPLTYRAVYTAFDGRHFCVWKMWLNKIYKVDDVLIQ